MGTYGGIEHFGFVLYVYYNMSSQLLSRPPAEFSDPSHHLANSGYANV